MPSLNPQRVPQTPAASVDAKHNLWRSYGQASLWHHWGQGLGRDNDWLLAGRRQVPVVSRDQTTGRALWTDRRGVPRPLVYRLLVYDNSSTDILVYRHLVSV